VTAKVTIPYAFANATSPTALQNFDNDFNALAAATNEGNTLANYFVDAGTVNALSVSTQTGQTFTGGVAGAWLDVLVANNNTGATTLQINAGTATPVADLNGNTLLQDALLGGCVYRLVFDGSIWRAQNMRRGNGSFVATGTGFSGAAPTFTIAWSIVNFDVTAAIQGGLFSYGSSSSNQFGLSGVPTFLQPPTTTQFCSLPFVYDNGIQQYTGVVITIPTGSNTWPLGYNFNNNAFTASGNKGFYNGATIYQPFHYLLI
jgi:hypothetical protein